MKELRVTRIFDLVILISNVESNDYTSEFLTCYSNAKYIRITFTMIFIRVKYRTVENYFGLTVGFRPV